MIDYELSQEAKDLALYFGEQFLNYVLYEFLPDYLANPRSFLLRSDWDDLDRNIVSTAWSRYRLNNNNN